MEGDSAAQRIVGNMYYEGKGVPKNYKGVIEVVQESGSLKLGHSR